ncbi:unnamed protein product [Rotaria sordida]|uniref:Uncharacterized protein n=2 Tax=Rotaria sordida TaxID=392033 RepID=A0A820H263_9BILA|nr:unnamed protein product [Rotaria sordida]
MSELTFLKALLYLHERVFGDKYDAMIVTAHENAVLNLDKRTSQFLELSYRKGAIVIDTKYAIDQRYFYVTLKIGEDRHNDFMPTANYVNNC